MKIYFAGAIRGGRDDVALYLELVELLRPYGTVLTEHVADEQLTSRGESMDDRAIPQSGSDVAERCGLSGR